MPAPEPTPINELLWTSTRYSDVLKLDRRVVAQALEKAPSTQYNGDRVWHVRDAMPAIFKPEARNQDPSNMEPKEALDYYRAQRERIKLQEDMKRFIPVDKIEQAIGDSFKALAQSLDALPDALERDCGLPATAVTSAQQAVDSMREALYANLIQALSVDGPAEP